MEMTLKMLVLTVQLALASYVLWGGFMCIAPLLIELRAMFRASQRSFAAERAASSAQPIGFERVASLVLLALLCTTLAGVV